VFLSYSGLDERRLLLRKFLADLKRLRCLDIAIWQAKIPRGTSVESVKEFLRTNLATADFYLGVLSRKSWSKHPLDAEYEAIEEIKEGRQDLTRIAICLDTIILPPEDPYFPLSHYIDHNYTYAFHELAAFLQAPATHLIATFALDTDCNGRTILGVTGSVDRKLIHYFATHPDEMKRMDHRLFEEFVAELFYGFGFEVELTQRTRDGGRDVIAIAHREAHLKYLIECKRPAPERSVRVSAVRALYGVKADEGASKGILATTAHFSADALLFFSRHTWELEARDFEGVMEWVKGYTIGSPPNPSLQRTPTERSPGWCR